MSAKNIKIFIASAGEVRAEREKAILLLNDLRKAHRHLDLEPVEWEYDTIPGSQPGFDSVQDAINPKLAESHIAVFIFYSRIGHYTKVEFDLAQELGKKFFVLFKEGFSPNNEDEIEAYKALIQFKRGLNKTVVHEQYEGEDGFCHRLYRCLNVYLSEAHPSGEVNQQLSDQNNTLIRLLEEKREEVGQLKAQLPSAAVNDQIIKLNEKITSIEAQLLQSEELRQQQAADKAALEQKLAGQKESDQLKAHALEAVEKGDYATAENLLQESAKDSIVETASTFYELAKLKKLQLKYREAFDFYELAAKIESNNSLYLNEAGVMADQLGYAGKAIAYYEKSLPLAIAEYGERHSEIAIRYNNLGVTYCKKGEYDNAIRCHKQALDIGKKFYGELNPDIAFWYNNLGEVYYHTGEYDQAIVYYKQALDIGKNCYGERYPEIVTRYNNLGLAYQDKGEYDKAIEYYEWALSIGKEFYGERHPAFAILFTNFGEAYRYKGEYDKAIGYYEQGLSICKEFYGERHPIIAVQYNNIGLIYDSKEDYGRAIGYYEQSLDINKEFYGERHPEIATVYNNLGEAYRCKGENDRAIEYYKQALDIGNGIYRKRHPDIAALYNNLGGVYYSKGEYGAAIGYFEQAYSIVVEFLPREHPHIAIVQESLQVAKDAQAGKGEGNLE